MTYLINFFGLCFFLYIPCLLVSFLLAPIVGMGEFQLAIILTAVCAFIGTVLFS